MAAFGAKNEDGRVSFLAPKAGALPMVMATGNDAALDIAMRLFHARTAA